MNFQVKKASRKNVSVKVALMGSSGSGKTFTALRIAKGMSEEIEKLTGTKGKILMLNTEEARGYYYANEFDYDIVDLSSPYSPEVYIEAIRFAENSGYDILIIDSTSHEWEGTGGCLDLHKQAGGQWKDWDRFVLSLMSVMA